jgi:hypothetical protein
MMNNDATVKDMEVCTSQGFSLFIGITYVVVFWLQSAATLLVN